MVSGHGVKGGRGRCYTLWRDFMACLETEGSISMKICRHQRDDYMECLHHVKLAKRLEAIRAQKAKLIAEGKWPPK
ncbi:NADH dehydrogenase [ubiquinone] iron-sulfur protein 5-B [Geodia barretti]|uniref:NADH dehydrogenase [ubiquinone] iron-sulfur protein 5 n=1 Tax=Geodia barretti TaxID=519541 RepID=A0AA35WRY0_GEOBA|nr:NADH dehydrogenase [ubiquinone] iron-sulfur protein 5-B [Geodia barretti]